MRIAVSGSHATGKSTLISELARRHPDFTPIDELYYTLENEGHAFRDPPAPDDYEELIDASIALMAQPQTTAVLFDRSPADYLAYLAAVSQDAVSRERIADVKRALSTLDLVVFVPIEQPDRIHVAGQRKLRRHVDEILSEMFVDDAWSFGVRVLRVDGSVDQRATQVHARLQSLGWHASSDPQR